MHTVMVKASYVWLLTIACGGCFKDLLCISSSLLVNPLLMSALGTFNKKPTQFFCFHKAQIMRELYFECT